MVREQMMGKQKPSGGNCPIDYALTVFGDRWTLLVVRDLMFRGKRHFREIIESPEGIASNILATRLQKLEAHGLIVRYRDPENRKQVVYELTKKGLDLAPMLIEMIRWSGTHDPDTGAPKAFLDRARRDRDGLVKEIVAAARPKARHAARASS
jgi:DNA-binding HxlR family transcriptional regulator